MSQTTDTTRDPILDEQDPAAEAASAAPETASADTTGDAPAAESSDKKSKFPKGILFFGACAVLAIIIYAVANSNNIADVFTQIGDILAPITIGGVMAYLCNPIMRFFEYVVFGKMKKGALHSGLSLFLTVLTVLGILAGMVALILPELIGSIQHLIDNSDTYISAFLEWANALIQDITANTPIDIDISTPEKLAEFLESTVGDMSEIMTDITAFLNNINAAGSVWDFVVQLVTAFKNIFIGMFIAFYILGSKEKRAAQVNKARAALLNEKQDRKLTELVTLVDKTCGGYIKGILLDSLVVGIVMFIVLSIFGVSEYNLLIAAICAVTNVIPVFGPFIGAIPSALIVLISNPSQLLTFILIVLVIQQLDGNILVPMIHGSNTGISSLAVLVAITIMGSLFGLMGMVIGVPIFAVIIELCKRFLESRLEAKGLPTDTVDYYPDDAIGNAEEEVYYEHSHWRYKYEHSKLRVHIDNMREKFAAAKRRREERKAARTAAQPESGSKKKKNGRKKK